MPSAAEKAREYITPTSLPMKEALEFWNGKTPLSRSAAEAMAKINHGRSFVIAGITEAAMLQRVYDEIGRSLADGVSFRDFKKSLPDVWKKAGFTGGKAYRIENIFRTNMQSAYAAGRYKQMSRVARRRPFWQYRAVGDKRTRLSHAAMNGRVFPANDPVWNTWYPPNGYMCRCKVVSLSARQVKKRGLKVRKGSTVIMQPDQGFRNNPGMEFFKPSLKNHRPDLRQQTLSKMVDGLCPDKDFADGDSPCLRRLKKLLSNDDLKALETVMWEKKTGGVEGYEKWVDEVLERRQARGELYPIGNLPASKIDKLEKKPLMSLVVMDDKQLIHLYRDVKVKRGAALTIEEIKDIPHRFASAQWYEDTKDPALLMTWLRFGTKHLKVVMKMDRRIGKAGVIANKIMTAGEVTEGDLKNPRYKKL